MATTRDEDAATVVHAVQHLYREATSLAGALADASGLHPNDTSALRALDLLAAQACTPGEIANAMGLSPAAVTGLVDRLVAADLACRSAHPTDRRRVQVELTPRARTFGAQVLRPLLHRISGAVEATSDRDLRTVAKFLSRLGGTD